MKHLLLTLSLAISNAAIGATAHDHKQPKDAAPGVSSLDVIADADTLHLLIATRHPDAPAKLEYLRSADAGATWTTPLRIGIDQPPTIAKRGMDAQIAAAGNAIVAVWPTAGTDKMGRGPMATAISPDGGKTWRPGPNPGDDGLTIGRSFIDILADAAGVFHLAWLDSRDGDAKGLRYARSSDGGATWSANQTLDANTCECCWNAFGLAPDGRLAVLYRNADPRDMAVVTSTSAGKSWFKPATVGAFNWAITACPHVGGAIIFTDPRTAYAAVWTARDADTYGIYVLGSRDAGASWREPVRVGPPEASRPDLVSDSSGRLTLVYDAYLEGAQSVFTSSSGDAGATWSAPQRLSEPAASATHGRLVSTPSGLRVFWTEQRPGELAGWRIKTVPVHAALPVSPPHR